MPEEQALWQGEQVSEDTGMKCRCQGRQVAGGTDAGGGKYQGVQTGGEGRGAVGKRVK